MGAAQGSAGWVSLVPLVLVFAVFYFIVMVPARKQQKKKEAMIAALKKGDRVVTTGGIYGTIAGVEDKTVLLKVSENVKIRVAKSAIAGLAGPSAIEP